MNAIENFRSNYDGELTKLGFVLREVGNSYLIYKKYPASTHVADPSPDYILTISFDNDRIKDIKLTNYKYYLVNEYHPKKLKHTDHFISMEKLLVFLGADI